MRIRKQIVLGIDQMTIIELRAVLNNLRESSTWVGGTVTYGVSEQTFDPRTINSAVKFADEEGQWSFDYDPHFALYLTFRNEEDAVLCKLQCLLDI